MQSRAYQFKLQPNTAQLAYFCRAAGVRRWVYNWCIETDQKQYQERRKGLTAFGLNYLLTELKRQPGYQWLQLVNAQTIQEVTKDFYHAKVRFLKKQGRRPRFKRRHRDAARFKTRQGTKFKDNKLWCPSLGWIKVQKNRTPEGDVKGANYRRDACGDWWVSVITEVPDQPPPCDPLDNPIGMDLGLIEFIHTSTGEQIPAPRLLRKSQRKLARAQRVVVRRKKKSNRRKRAKTKAAKIHRKVARQRNDFQHKLSCRLTNTNSLICLETLNLNGLARTKLAKSFRDAGHGEFIRQLKYKAARKGGLVVQVDRWFPSSKMCSICERMNTGLSLGERHWKCSRCGTDHDRDSNAARNILAEGLRLVAGGRPETQNGRGASVRLPSRGAVGEEASIPEVLTPSA